MQELWQLYDEQGRQIVGKGAPKSEVRKGLLHAASHIWMWRQGSSGPEVLLQKRALGKPTWGGLLDISAAGHIDLGEDPITAALREIKEEIGIDVDAGDLKLICVHRAHLATDSGIIENEFQWLYVLQLPADTAFAPEEHEVASVEWRPLKTFKQEVMSPPHRYVPHGALYYSTVIAGIERSIKST